MHIQNYGEISKMLKNVIVSNIQPPITVVSPKGRQDITKNRSTYGISFCMNGQITYMHKGKQYISTKNTAILLPKGETYSIQGDKDGVFLVINFDCVGLNCSDIVTFPLQNPDPFYKDFQTLAELFLFPDKQLDIYLNFYRMLKQIMREQVPQNHALSLALKYIETHISNPELSNSLIAKHAHISEVYLRKLFGAKYHISPKQYILDIRIQKAKQLLSNSLHSISAISEQCGFSSVYTFSRCFKEKTGISPTEYAKENRMLEI